MPTKQQRQNILLDLIHFNDNLKSLEKRLKELPWDSEEVLVFLSESILLSALQKLKSLVHSESQIAIWANLIEMREDIGYENEEVKEAIHYLSNLEINGGYDWEGHPLLSKL